MFKKTTNQNANSSSSSQEKAPAKANVVPNKPYLLTNAFKTTNVINDEISKIRITKPIIDKLSLIFEFKSRQQAQKIVDTFLQMDCFSNYQSSFGTYYFYYEFLSVSMKTKRVEFIIIPSLRTIQIVFNPSLFSSEGLNQLDICLSRLDPQWSLSYLFKVSKISRIDITRDILGMDIEHFIFHCKNNQTVFTAFTRSIFESVKFGKPKYSQFSIYNKVKENASKYPNEKNVTRVEYQFKSKMNGNAIIKLKNPFPKVEIYQLDLERISLIPAQYHQMALDSIRIRGYKAALATMKLTKVEIAKSLRELKKEPWMDWITVGNNWDEEWQETLRTYRLIA
ncbi:MAG: hypothetical protein PW788_07610 [Micavibrio sp.]|nr:hypothetical protein [Micavibrio sp.]